MDFSKAIEAHISWKRKLTDFIAGRGGDLDPHNATNDHACDIGNWIHSEGMKYSEIPEYQELKKNHAKFHLCVGDIIKLKMEGQGEKAFQSLNNLDSDYKLYTSKTVNSIVALQNVLKKMLTI